MRINGFVWLPDVADKVENKHHLDREEVEEVFFNRPRYRLVERGYRAGEDVYAATGQTDAGRYTIVFFILKEDSSALILSARDMDGRERRRHERKWSRGTDEYLQSRHPREDRRVLGLSQPFRLLGEYP